MNKLHTSQIKKNVEKWALSILQQISIKKESSLLLQLQVLLELSGSLSSTKEIPFELIFNDEALENSLKSSPLLTVETLLLLKKYNTEFFTEKMTVMIDDFETLLLEVYTDASDNADLFLLLNLLCRLREKELVISELPEKKTSEDAFLCRPKSAIKESLNHLLIASCFGLKELQLTTSTRESIETIMLDAAAKYDLVLAAKAMRVLLYSGMKKGYGMKLVYDFLCQNQSIEGYIGHYEDAFVVTGTQKKSISQQIQITKEVLIAILEYDDSYRYLRDFTAGNTLISTL